MKCFRAYRFLVFLTGKLKGTAIDLFYDNTNREINYVDEIVHCTCDSVQIIAGVQHIDGPLQVKYWEVWTPVTPAALTPMSSLPKFLLYKKIHSMHIFTSKNSRKRNNVNIGLSEFFSGWFIKFQIFGIARNCRQPEMKASYKSCSLLEPNIHITSLVLQYKYIT